MCNHMKLTSRTLIISAPVSQVYKFISDINLIFRELKHCIRQDNSDLKIALEADYIVFFNQHNEKIGKLSIEETEINRSSSILIEPITTALKMFGTIIITSKLHEMPDHISCYSIFKTEKEPSFFWRIIIKILFKILLFQSRKHEKELIMRIERGE